MHRHTERDDPIDHEFDALLSSCFIDDKEKQAAFAIEIERYGSWHLDADTLRFLNEQEALTFEVTVIATYMPGLRDRFGCS